MRTGRIDWFDEFLRSKVEMMTNAEVIASLSLYVIQVNGLFRRCTFHGGTPVAKGYRDGDRFVVQVVFTPWETVVEAEESRQFLVNVWGFIQRWSLEVA